MNRNYKLPKVDPEWSRSRDTHEAIGVAIHAVATAERVPQDIWQGPTLAEIDNIKRAVAEYVRLGDFDAAPDDKYEWGHSFLYLTRQYGRDW